MCVRERERVGACAHVEALVYMCVDMQALCYGVFFGKCDQIKLLMHPNQDQHSRKWQVIVFPRPLKSKL